MTDNDLVWEAPPEKKRRTKYGPIVEELKKNQGRWARVRVVGQASSGWSVRKSLLTAAGNDEALEVVTGKIDGEDNYAVWARYRTPEQMKAVKR